jgi:hypothetical protein
MNYINCTFKIFLNALVGAVELPIPLHYELLHDCFCLEKILLSWWVYNNPLLYFLLL